MTLSPLQTTSHRAPGLEVKEGLPAKSWKGFPFVRMRIMVETRGVRVLSVIIRPISYLVGALDRSHRLSLAAIDDADSSACLPACLKPEQCQGGIDAVYFKWSPTLHHLACLSCPCHSPQPCRGCEVSTSLDQGPGYLSVGTNVFCSAIDEASRTVSIGTKRGQWRRSIDLRFEIDWRDEMRKP